MKKDRKNIFMNSPFPWWEWDLKQNKVDFNDLKASMLGYDPIVLRNKGYQAFTDLVHPEDYEKTMHAMRLVLKRQKDLYQVDYKIKSLDGSYHWYLDRGIVIESNDTEILKIRGLVIDLGKQVYPGIAIDKLVDLFSTTTDKSADFSESILTLCSSCEKAKVSNFEWIPITEQIEDLLSEKISHGICPKCLQQLYPDIADEILERISE